MKDFLSRIKRQFLINSIGGFYRDECYDLILKHLRRPYSMKREEEVLANMFRILALNRNGKNNWHDEFEYLMDNDMLLVFNEDTQNYLSQYLSENLPEISLDSDTEKLDTSKVSKRVKKYFLSQRL